MENLLANEVTRRLAVIGQDVDQYFRQRVEQDLPGYSVKTTSCGASRLTNFFTTGNAYHIHPPETPLFEEVEPEQPEQKRKPKRVAKVLRFLGFNKRAI